MAKPKTYPRLTREAADPTTAPARLDYLSRHHDPTVRRLALVNPALPGARLTEALRLGYPPAWGNPAALWALLEMPPADAQEGAVRAVTELARCRKRTAAVEPPHVVTETMSSLLRPHLLAAWEDCDHDGLMVDRMARYALSCGSLSPQHHVTTLLTCLRLRAMAPALAGPIHVADAEAFAWSGTTSIEDQRRMLDLAMEGSRDDARWFAAIPSPQKFQSVYATGYIANVCPPVPGVADLLRAAMPVPMWLDELTPPPSVAP